MSSFDPELFRLLDEESISLPYTSAFEYDYSIYEWKRRRILYNDRRQVFSLSGDRVCLNGIRNNSDLGDYISVTFSSLDSNFLTISDAVLNEVKKIYPTIESSYISKKFIKITIPEFVRFYKNRSIVESPPRKTRFEIAFMRVGFSQVKVKYKDNNLNKIILELLAYNIYLQ